jgi:hypothetical protein
MSTTTHRPRLHAPIAAALFGALAGCGGGGGSPMQSGPTTEPAPHVLFTQKSVPAPAEPFNIALTTLTASSGGNSYAGTFSEKSNKGTTMFAGQEANTSTTTLTITENGSPIVTEIETAYYLENPYQPLGLSISHNGGQIDFLYNSTNPLPSTLAIGDSGQLGSGTYYAVNTNKAIGSLTETYSVTQNSVNGFVILNTNATGTVNGQSISEKIGYVINGGEALGVASVETLVNGTTLIFATDCAGCWGY